MTGGRRHPGVLFGLPSPLAPGPAEITFYYYFDNFSIIYYKLPFIFLVDPHAGALVPRGRRIQRAAPTTADPEKKTEVALKWGFELASASIRQLGH